MNKKLIILTFIIIASIISAKCYSQITFDKIIGESNYNEFPSNIIRTNDDTYLLAVLSNKLDLSYSFSTIYEYDVGGNIIKNTPVYKQDTTLKIVGITSCAEEGKYLCIGSLHDSFENKDIWIAKIDSDHNIINEVIIPTSDSITELGYAYFQKKAFSHYILISYYDEDYFSNIFIIKCDDAINNITLSDWVLNGFAGDFVKNIHNENFLISGGYLSRSDNTIWEMDSDMKLLGLVYDGSQYSMGNLNDMEWLCDNRLVMAGGFTSPDYDDTRLMGIKVFDTSFLEIHNNAFGQIGVQNYTGARDAIAITPNDEIFFTGSQFLIPGGPAQPIYNHIPVHKLDSTLQVISSGLLGGDAYYTTRSIAPTPDGGCIIAATRYDYQSQDDLDVYLVGIGANGIVTDIDIPETENEISVYPNPGKDQVTITLEESQFTFQLYSVSGKQVLEVKNQKTINTSALNSGIYFYRIINDKQLISKGKWVKY